jgi:hypothetical protein
MQLMYIPIRSNDEHIGIHRKIFTIATSYIRAYSAVGLLFEEALDYGPRLDWVS